MNTITPKGKKESSDDTVDTGSGQRNSGTERMIVSLGRIFLPLLALVLGVGITMHLLKTGPQAKQLPKKKNATLVETRLVQVGIYSTSVSAMGVVQAAQSIELKPQTSGEVIAVSEQFLPGGRFVFNQELVQLDKRDYQLSMRQQASQVARAKSDLELESGNQLVAKREFDLLGENVSAMEKKLMLREPQLQSLEIALEIAEAKYEQVYLDFERTTIRAPFNGIVQSREVNVGSNVSVGENLATLIGTDCYWVEVSVAEEQLQWIVVPGEKVQKGAQVRIYNPTAWGEMRYRKGNVVQMLPGLETQGRMVRLLIEIVDPLAIGENNQGEPKLFVDSFVRVVIEGKAVSPAIELSREYLRDGTNVWVFLEDGTLDIREVTIAFKNKDNVLVTAGILEKEELIISNLSTPIAGMLLKKTQAGSLYADSNVKLAVKDLVADQDSAEHQRGVDQ